MQAQTHFIQVLARSYPAHACLPTLRASLGSRILVRDNCRISENNHDKNTWLVVPHNHVWHTAGLSGICRSVFGLWSSIIASVFTDAGIDAHLSPAHSVQGYRGRLEIVIWRSESKPGELACPLKRRVVGKG